MAKGIIYIMETVVPGLIKIGKTVNFDSRMRDLEKNGYRNVTGLSRLFAIEVDNYDEKEVLLHTIFEKSRVSDTELFAVDKNIAVQLLSSFDGKQVFPLSESKEEVFTDATDIVNGSLIPDGIYTFTRKKRDEKNELSVSAEVKNGKWTLQKGSVVALCEGKGLPDNARMLRKRMSINKDGVLLEDFEISECSPSLAGSIVLFASCNGWSYWHNADGKPIDIYRKTAKQQNDIDD